ncbi:MAG: hypothetical protein OEZ47_12385, partial [Gammaproteobacteria bacterium]|nr:hypothetical protein [Gammaproteobacteria bacterium]
SFDLPDFNGKVRLMAMVFTRDRFGMAEENVTIAAPVVAEISKPRFLTAYDKSVISMDIQNLSGTKQTLNIDLKATAPLELENKPQTITLNDGEKKVIKYPVTAAGDFGLGDLDFTLENVLEGNGLPIKLNRHWDLAVRPAFPSERRKINAMLEPGASLELGDELKDLIPSTVETELTVSPLPPIDIRSQIQGLLKYPYGCLEQTTSSTYPWVYASQENFEKLGMKDFKLYHGLSLDKRIEYMEVGARRLKGKQLSNGGYGLWSPSSPEEHWLTVFVADFLVDAREQGANVDGGMFDATMNRLTQYIKSNGSMWGERHSNSPNHYRFAYRAYAAYVLSRLNRGSMGALRNLYDQQRSGAQSGLPLAHLGLALLKQGDTRRGMDAIEEGIAKAYAHDRYYYLGDYGGKVRDLALMVYLLHSNKVDAPYGELVNQLAETVKQRNNFSTQERIALFKAGTSLALSRDKKWSGELFLSAAQQEVKTAGDYQQSLGYDDLSGGLRFKNTHDDILNAQLSIEGHSTNLPSARMEEIEIIKNYYDREGDLIATTRNGEGTLPELESGALVLVEVQIKAKRRIPDGLLIDLLPGGLELENQNLAHSVKLSSFKINNRPATELLQNNGVVHQEYLDDRYIAAIDLKQSSTAHVVYVARVVSPGEYLVPPTIVEDMYRPYLMGISHGVKPVKINNSNASASN